MPLLYQTTMEALLRLAAAVSLALFCTPSWSLPMGFKDSWMVMGESSAHGREATVNYAYTHQDSIGLSTNVFKHEGRPHRWDFNELLVVRKAHRWNLPNAQANFWLMGGIGQMEGHRQSTRLSYSPGFQLDYETTRLYAGLNARLFRAEGVNLDTASLKLGASFYEVDYNEVQPWFMVDVKRTRSLSDEIEITPTLRFIHNRYFFELGINQSGDLRASFMYLY